MKLTYFNHFLPQTYKTEIEEEKPFTWYLYSSGP
jgi:histone deacetylase complex regulatory component SIN3